MSERAQQADDADATVVLPTPGRKRSAFAPSIERHAAAADLAALGGLNPLVEAANPILAAVPQIRHALRHPDPADWIMMRGNYEGHGCSRLDQINKTNVKGLQLVVTDIAGYDAFYKRLIAAVPLKNVTSRFAMEKIKSTTSLPIP